MVLINLPDGSQKEYQPGTSVKEIAEDVNKKLARKAVTAVFNDKLADWNEQITENGSLRILDFDDEAGKNVYRHSSAHVMAQAVKKLCFTMILTVSIFLLRKILP